MRVQATRLRRTTANSRPITRGSYVDLSLERDRRPTSPALVLSVLVRDEGGIRP